MDIVVAVYEDWGIGRDGTQPVVIPEDRRHFRQVTGSGAVIVGRKTLEDFPGGRPLKGRVNIVLTKQNLQIEDAIVVHSILDALKEAAAYEDVFVIGGESVFRAMLPYCRRAFVTKISLTPVSDSFFPNLDELPEWHIIDPGEIRQHEEISYSFVTYERR